MARWLVSNGHTGHSLVASHWSVSWTSRDVCVCVCGICRCVTWL